MAHQNYITIQDRVKQLAQVFIRKLKNYLLCYRLMGILVGIQTKVGCASAGACP